MTDLKPPLKPGYSLWLMPDEPWQGKLQTMIDELADSFGTPRFIAHATLLGLIDPILENYSSISAKCKKIAQLNRSLSIELVGVGMRDLYFQSVFLPAVPSPGLMDLNKNARWQFGRSLDPPYFPHFSAVYGDLPVEVKAAIKARIPFAFPCRVPISQLALCNNEGNPDQWKIVDLFPLQKPSMPAT